MSRNAENVSEGTRVRVTLREERVSRNIPSISHTILSKVTLREERVSRNLELKTLQ